MASYESLYGDPTAADYAKNNIVTIITPGGVKLNVNRQAADAFKEFLTELEGTGYKINSAGGYNLRNITGGNTLSSHAFGTAIDINPDKNLYDKSGKLTTDLPGNVGDIAAKYGLTWGGNWKSPTDAMHFEYGWSPHSYSALSAPETPVVAGASPPSTPAAPDQTTQAAQAAPYLNDLIARQQNQLQMSKLDTINQLMGMFKGNAPQQGNMNSGFLQALALAGQTGRGGGSNKLLFDDIA